MKARIKSTGEIIEVAYLTEDKYGNKYYSVTTDTRTYRETELEMMSDKGDYFYTYDYWTRLEHQYAGVALSRLVELVNPGYEYVYEEVAILATNYAHALVEKMKEAK